MGGPHCNWFLFNKICHFKTKQDRRNRKIVEVYIYIFFYSFFASSEFDAGINGQKLDDVVTDSQTIFEMQCWQNK